MDWNDLRFLLALSEHGDLASAAESVAVNRTTVARRIERLEVDLGVKLVQRVGRDLVLTDAGREAVASAEVIEGEIQHLQRQVFGRDSELAGAIRLTTTPTVGELLAPYLAEFQRAHPDVAIELMASMIAQDLSTFSADVAVRLTNSPPQDLAGRVLVRPMIAIYCSHETAAKLSRLKTINAVTMLNSFPSWASELISAELKPTFDSNSADVAKAIVADSESVAVLPCYVGEHDPRLKRVSETRQDQFAALWLLYHPRLRKIQRFRVFAEFLVEAFADMRDLFEG